MVKIFCQPMAYLFIFLLVTFKEQQFLILIMSNLTTFYCLYFLCPTYKNHCSPQGHKDFLLCFLLEIFIILAFVFKPIVHFEIVFSWGLVKGDVNFFPYGYPVFWHCMLKWLGFLYWITLAPLFKISWPHMHGSISRISILFHWACYFYTNTTLPWLL